MLVRRDSSKFPLRMLVYPENWINVSELTVQLKSVYLPALDSALVSVLRPSN